MEPASSGSAALELIPPERRKDPDIRKAMSGPAIRAFFNIADKWNLSVEERRALLGWPGVSTYHKYRRAPSPPLPFDMLARISLVLGIFKALNILYPDQALADRWMKLPNTNPVFSGLSPISFIAAGGMDSLYQVRRLLDARRGGWN